MKKYILTLLIAVMTLPLAAQQDPQYSQYMFNGLVLNPAYAGSREYFSATFLYRAQWLGMDGGPRTQSLGIHAPSANLRHGFGLNFFNDKVGVSSATSLRLAYAFRIPIGERANLSLGLEGSFENFRNNYSQLRIVQPNGSPADGVFTDTPDSRLWAPNVGTGAYFQSKHLYLGASVPRLLTVAETERDNQNGIADNGGRLPQYLFTGGGMIPLGRSVKFKPSFLVKATANSPVSVDLNGSFLFADMIWVGASYRINDAAVFMLELWPAKNLRIGYAYDLTISELADYNSGSHEFMIGFDFDWYKKNYISPRYF